MRFKTAYPRLFPGCLVHLDDRDSAAPEGSISFADARVACCISQRGSGFTLSIDSYHTLAGAAVAARQWSIEPMFGMRGPWRVLAALP